MELIVNFFLDSGKGPRAPHYPSGNRRVDKRWGIFALATIGDMLPGYNSQSGGVTNGVSFRVNPVINVGAYTGYEGTYAKYNGGSTLVDNSVRFGVFGSYGKQNFIFQLSRLWGSGQSY
jgi:hypothetical protein